MNATWDPVPDGYVHGILLGYRRYFTKTRELGYATSDQTERNTTVGPEVLNTTITGLSNFATYNLEITAFTIKGEGPRSAIKEGCKLCHASVPCKVLFPKLEKRHKCSKLDRVLCVHSIRFLTVTTVGFN